MKLVKNKLLLNFLLVIPVITAFGCAGSSPRAVPVGPVPNTNGVPGTGDQTLGKGKGPAADSDPFSSTGGAVDPGTKNTKTGSDPATSPASTGTQTPPDGTKTTPPGAQAATTTPPAAQAMTPPVVPAMTPPVPPPPAPANCTANYALGYGDPYQSNGTGPWLAKNKSDYTEPCLINAPTCTAQDGLGYGTKFAHGKLWLAKLTDANKGIEDVCIITKLTGTSG